MKKTIQIKESMKNLLKQMVIGYLWIDYGQEEYPKNVLELIYG